MFKNIFNKIRLFRSKKKESYFVLAEILGFYPGDITLYEEALLHKSSSKEGSNGHYLNNERLEFLGDAILDAIIADIAFKKFPNKNEGFLTNTRSKIVKRETMNKIAKELGLHKLIVSSTRVSTQKSHILGNALEAFIGAVYLDQGYRKTHCFVENKIMKPYIDIDALAKKEVNFKSKLLEWCQKYKVTLDYKLIENFVDNYHNTIFQSQVLLNGLVAGVGTGYSKKESHQQASQMAMLKIKKEKSFMEEVLALCEKEETVVLCEEKDPLSLENEEESSDSIEEIRETTQEL
ncbi:MAG: ribonuclease III [Bacteroidales bacterium]|nr:ribonuclease III [Bacteroidales bacterium]